MVASPENSDNLLEQRIAADISAHSESNRIQLEKITRLERTLWHSLSNSDHADDEDSEFNCSKVVAMESENNFDIVFNDQLHRKAELHDCNITNEESSIAACVEASRESTNSPQVSDANINPRISSTENIVADDMSIVRGPNSPAGNDSGSNYDPDSDYDPANEIASESSANEIENQVSDKSENCDINDTYIAETASTDISINAPDLLLARSEICDQRSMTVDPSQGPKGKGKKNFCVFCHKMQTKLPRHLESHHKSETEVIAFSERSS